MPPSGRLERRPPRCYAHPMSLSTHRRPLFWAFTILFFLTSAAVLFLAFGYRFNLERGIFVYTGSITLSTLPRSVHISLDGEPLPEQRVGLLNNTLHITGLMPGEHTIAVTAPGYKPWEKDAFVRSGIATEFWNVVLLREDYPAVALPDTENVIALAREPGKNIFAAAKVQAGQPSVVLIEEANGTQHEIFSSADHHWSSTVTDKLSWSPNGKQLLLLLEREGALDPAVLNVAEGTLLWLTDLSPTSTLTDIRWDPTDSDSIWTLSQGTLLRLTLGDTPSALIAGNTIRAFGFSGNSVLTLSDSGLLLRLPKDSASTSAPEQFSRSVWSDLGSEHWDLIPYDEDRILLAERSGRKRLVLWNHLSHQDETFTLLGENIESYQFSDDGKKVLLATSHEIEVTFTRAWEVQPARTAGTILQIARFSDPIEQVQWTEDYEHVLFARGQTIKIAELDHRDHRILGDITTLSGEPQQILPRFDENRLYFVTPGFGVTSIVFPEPQGLFGI